jgi:FlaA1/EpsC-like NDP-sugar epimerase
MNRNEIFVSKEFSDYGFIRGNSIVIDKKSISSQLKGKTVLITGAAGDIGCEIVCALPLKIIMVDQAETPLHHLILQVEKQSQVHRFTLLLLTSEIMQGWTLCFNCINHVVYHAAAYHHVF